MNARDLTPAPDELQPRERKDRIASEAQIAEIASTLDPARLMPSADADRGPPIVGPDGVIESGNGRVAAIMRAAEQHPERYAAYVQTLRDAGYTIPEGDGVPALVARRTTEFATPADRRAFVEEANVSPTAQLSAGEQARVDGGKLTGALLDKYDHAQDVTSGANRDFVRAWMDTVPSSERGRLMLPDGALSADGVRRLSGALLARAYDDRGVLARGLESTDDAIRSVSAGLADAAPVWARVRAGIEEGRIPAEWDTSRQLVRAADLVRDARERRLGLTDILNQADAFDPIDPVTEQYIRALYNTAGTRAASRPAIADVLTRYAEEALRQTHDGGLFGAEARAQPADALRAIVGSRKTEAPTAQGSMLGAGTELRPRGTTPEPTRGQPAPRDYAAEAEAIARRWDALGNPTMASAIRSGAKLGVTDSKISFWQTRLAEAEAKAGGDAPKPNETFTLDRFMAGDKTDMKVWRVFQDAATPEGKALSAEVEARAQALVRQMNDAGYTSAGIDATSPRQMQNLKRDLSELLGTHSRFMRQEVANAKGYKTAKPAQREATRGELRRLLDKDKQTALVPAASTSPSASPSGAGSWVRVPESDIREGQRVRVTDAGPRAYSGDEGFVVGAGQAEGERVRRFFVQLDSGEKIDVSAAGLEIEPGTHLVGSDAARAAEPGTTPEPTTEPTTGQRTAPALTAEPRTAREPTSEPTTRGAAADRPAGGMADVPVGLTRPPLGGVRPTRDVNAETSPYRQVFRDAGRNPDLMVSRPIQEQVDVIRDHVRDSFGFRAVELDPRQDLKELRDQLSNFYQNAREMAAALGMPYRALGLDGRLALTSRVYRQANQALGSYYPGRRTIEIPGRSNSWAHEWTHALDHYLSDALASNPRAMRLLSETHGIQQDPGRIGGRRIQPDTVGAAFVGVLRAMYGRDAAHAAEALRLQLDLRGRDRAAAFRAMQRLEQIETEFAAGSRRQPQGISYWSAPHEMLARAHEAYVSDMIQRAGGDTRAVAKPYYVGDVQTDGFARVYPQQAERDRIFQAFTELHDAIRAQTLLGPGRGARPDGLDIVDPSTWSRLANPAQQPGLWAALRREAAAQSHFRAQLWERAGFSANRANPGRLTLGARAADNFRELTYSIRGIGEALVHRQPPQAGVIYQQIMDRIAPAEGVRSAGAAAGRYIGPVYEQAVRARARPLIGQVVNILDREGLAGMTDTEALMMRHLLTEGSAHDFVPDGAPGPLAVPAAIQRAAGDLRYLLDQEWEANRRANIDIGYTRSGYFPRMYDDHKIYGDRAGFTRDGTELHRLIFEQTVGSEPANMVTAYGRLSEQAQSQLGPTVARQVDALRANLRGQQRLRDGLATSRDRAGDEARIRDLEDTARDLHDQLHDPVRDTYAQHAANDWWLRINTGDPTDFDTRGPNASYTHGRELPPESDRIMRNWMVNDPRQALPAYFQASARKIAWNERFGNGWLDDALLRASDAGARGEDNETIRRLVQSVTGRTKSGLPPGVERAANAIHAAGTIALMTRAAWSSLAEPVAVLARTGNTKAMFQAFAAQVGDIVRTAESRHRADLANAIGATTSHLYDSVIADRTEGHYQDSPGLGRLMSAYYRRTGLTQLTNSQRRSVMAAGHTALDAWSQELLGTNARLTRDAAAQFRDLGVPDAQHRALAEWVTARRGLPSLADLQTPGGQLWGHAVSALTDKIIQDPMRVEKPLMSQNPIGRLAYGLMSFNYAFYHNIIEHAFSVHGARIGEAFTEARTGGAGRIGAAAAALPAIGRAGVHLSASAAAIYAATLATTTLREALFNGETWQRHADDGTLGDWLSDLAIQRTGVNGPLDPLVQALTGLKYERDLSSLVAGAQAGFFLQAAGDVLKPFAGFGSPNTNTSSYNAVRGAWNMMGVPAIGTLATILPGGPLAGAGYGAAMQYLTSREVGDKVATYIAGPKGSGPAGEAPATRKAPAGTGGNVPIGLVDDLAAPAVRTGLPLWQRLPRVGQIGVGAAAAYTAGSALKDHLDQWKP